MRFARDRETFSQPVLILLQDEVYLRAYLKELALRFFGAKEGSREEKLLRSETFSDCLVYPPEGKKYTAELLRELLFESEMKSVEGGDKLFVLDQFDEATPLLQNKLLKVLEEQREGVYFLLGAKSESPILKTVLSRVKKFSVPPFSTREIYLELKKSYPDLSDGEAESIASSSGGIFSKAEFFLKDKLYSLAFEFLEGNSVLFCKQHSDLKEKREFLSALKTILKNALMIKTGFTPFLDLKNEKTEALAAEFPAGALIFAIERVGAAERELSFNAGTENCLYSLALSIEEEKRKWKKLSS